MPAEQLCSSCVKAKRGKNGKVQECLVLKNLLGKTGRCFAYSNDPDFWDNLRQQVELYNTRKASAG
ncbi:MAG: hypothetical protein HPY90_10090 [Syntrophothermus sp.]|uniref:hypothetical protein n=1 Tax=Syntrophothermus sp. TaxID=2736299 RepID=UPI002580744D|nr:hypothetical protein [Syntrophothermus sp.]NSW83601.1 hypothetical protein [Syntrophothermus sp.]